MNILQNIYYIYSKKNSDNIIFCPQRIYVGFMSNITFPKSNPIYHGYNFLFPKSCYTKKIVKISQPQNLLYNIKKFYHPSVFCKMNYRHSLKCFEIKIWGLGIEKRDFFM